MPDLYLSVWLPLPIIYISLHGFELHPFASTWKTQLRIVGVLTNLVFIWECLHIFLIFVGNTADIQSLNFSTLSISFQCLLTTIVSGAKLAVNFIEASLYAVSHFFSWCFQYFFFVFVFQQFHCILWNWVYPAWSLLKFINM